MNRAVYDKIDRLIEESNHFSRNWGKYLAGAGLLGTGLIANDFYRDQIESDVDKATNLDLRGVARRVIEKAKDLDDKVTGRDKNFMYPVTKYANHFGLYGIDKLNQLFGGEGMVAQAALQNVHDETMKNAAKLKESMENLKRDATGVAQDATKKVAEGVKNLPDGAKEGVKNLPDSTKEGVKNLKDSAANGLNWASGIL